MDRIVVEGGVKLAGEVRVSGSKNATLALMAAALLGRGETVLRNVPGVHDVEHMLALLRALGAKADWDSEAPGRRRPDVALHGLSRSAAHRPLGGRVQAVPQLHG